MPPQDQEVLFSLSLPLVVAVLLLLSLLVAAGGWLLARRRRPVVAPPLTPASIPWLPALLEPLPCGVLLADAQGQVAMVEAFLTIIPKELAKGNPAVSIDIYIQKVYDRFTSNTRGRR